MILTTGGSANSVGRGNERARRPAGTVDWGLPVPLAAAPAVPTETGRRNLPTFEVRGPTGPKWQNVEFCWGFGIIAPD